MEQDSNILKKMAMNFNDKIANRIYTVKGKDEAFDLKIAPSNFAHLIGLHKFHNPNSDFANLRDITNLKEFSGYLNVYKGHITLDMLCRAKDIKGDLIINDKDILDRLKNFLAVEKVLKLGELYEFDNKKCPLSTHLPPGYIFNLKEKEQEITILFSPGKGKDNNKFFPTSFFVNDKDNLKFGKYIENQRKIEIDKIRTTHFKKDERNIFRDSEKQKLINKER